MADSAEGAEFWLPSKFFDDIQMDKENGTTESDSEFRFPTEFPYDSTETNPVENQEKLWTLPRTDAFPARNDAVGDLMYAKTPNPAVMHHVYLQSQKQWYNEAPMVARLGQNQNAWPVQQNAARIVAPAVRAVGYGGGAAAKRECAGTGVFLPRRYGNSDSRKRAGASIPNRNVHPHKISENHGFLQPQPQPHLQQPKFSSEYDLLMARRNAMMLQHRRSLLHQGSSALGCTVPRTQLFID